MTVVDPNKSPMIDFMERVKNKVRDDIASMMPDEAIENLIRESIRNEFFDRKKVNKGNDYRPDWKEEPNEFQKMIYDHAKPLIEKKCQEFFEVNKEKINEVIHSVVGNGFMAIVEASMRGLVAQQMQENSYLIAQTIRNKGQL